MSTLDINLIQQDVGSFRRLTNLEEQLKRVAWLSLGGLFVSGLVIGGTYAFLSSRMGSLERHKQELTRQINMQNAKEGILLSLKERTAVADKALKAAKPWGQVFLMLGEILPAERFSSLAIDDAGRVSTIMNLDSIDEAVTAVSNTVTLAGDRKLRSPQLQSFVFREDGTVQISLLFQPVF